ERHGWVGLSFHVPYRSPSFVLVASPMCRCRRLNARLCLLKIIHCRALGHNAQTMTDAAVTAIGFVGVGRMGLPVCARLASAGFDITATDVRVERRGAAEAVGARWAGSVAAAADGGVLITMLPGSDEVLKVMPEALGALAPGSCWL